MMDIWVLKSAMLKEQRDSVLIEPGISNDTCETVEKCGICQASSRAGQTSWKCE